MFSVHRLKQQSQEAAMHCGCILTSASFCRPVLRMRKPWQFAALGVAFWIVIVLGALDAGVTAHMVPQLGGFEDNPATGQHLLEVCKAQERQVGVVLVQYWTFVVVFLLGSINTACGLTPAFRKAWDMDKVMLDRFNCCSSVVS
jgi:hypothetical protein